MKKFFNQLEQLFKASNYGFLDDDDVEKKLICLYAFYKFYRADSSSIGDLISSVTKEEDSLDKIDGIFLDTEADEETVELVSSYYVHDTLNFLSIDELQDYFKNMYNYASAASHKSKTARDKIIDILSDDDYAYGKSNKLLKINIITNYTPKASDRKKYLKRADSIKIDEFTTCTITFGNEIEQSVLEIDSPKEYVESGFVTLDAANNILRFGNENSMICNISAKSLKSLYENYSYQGLFAQNLRYYVKSTKTDSKIVDSIQNKADNFWYYNNGIIIICKDYSLSGNTLLLKDFSIINGGQTTKLIGDTDFDKDFYIQCKIVRNKYKTEKETNIFISEVAEASNTQKPIKDKDLVANRIEQRELKTKMASVDIFCQIKRGASINKKVYKEAWQNTTNEELGQLINSFFYQLPGSSRNNKSSLTSNEEKYNKIFKKDYNAKLLRDLCYVKDFYKQWQKHMNDTITKNDDEYLQGLLKNGFLFFVGIVGALVKLYYHSNYITLIQNKYSLNEKLNIISQYDISHQIFKDNILMCKQDVFNLFNFIYKKYVRDGFIDARDDKDDLVYSNFTKIDKNYQKYILKNIFKSFSKDDIKVISHLLYKPTAEELDMNDEILEEYRVDVNSKTITVDDLNEDEKEIFDKLKKYRTIQFKSRKIKAYEVFRDNDAATIVRFKPANINDLMDLNILKDIQITNYGDDIISILKGTYTTFNLN